MKIPGRKVADWAREIIDQCTVSRDSRRQAIREWKNYYNAGTDSGIQARYNRCYGHIDRLASYLFSPADVRFDIELDLTEDEAVMKQAAAAARYLNREFQRCGVDTCFSQGVVWALVKGATLVKTLWGYDGLEPWLVHPEFFGVLREDIADLDRQEAFVHSTYMTRGALERTLVEHPQRSEIMSDLEKHFDTRGRGSEDEYADSYFHQIVVGGIQPVSTTGQATGMGTVAVAANTPMLHPEIAKSLVRVDELWVLDTERQDWGTIRLGYPDVLIEGRHKIQNLSGVKGEHPFRKVCPNDTDGYFWGASEITQISPLQDMLNGQLRDVSRIIRLRADPPRAAIGFAGLTEEKYRALRRPGGFISEDTPNAKLETLAPELPPELFQAIDKTMQYFDDVAGFAPILQGQGEQGVRAGVHAQTLARNASPRMRDRALLVERQCVDVGEFGLKLLAMKEADVKQADPKEPDTSFMLSQLPDDMRITVDSHTSSPAFTDDNERKAFALHRAGAIDNADLITLTHPPHEDSLTMRAKARAEQEAKLLQQHPELLSKGKRRR